MTQRQTRLGGWLLTVGAILLTGSLVLAVVLLARELSAVSGDLRDLRARNEALSRKELRAILYDVLDDLDAADRERVRADARRRDRQEAQGGASGPDGTSGSPGGDGGADAPTAPRRDPPRDRPRDPPDDRPDPPDDPDPPVDLPDVPGPVDETVEDVIEEVLPSRRARPRRLPRFAHRSG